MVSSELNKYFPVVLLINSSLLVLFEQLSDKIAVRIKKMVLIFIILIIGAGLKIKKKASKPLMI